MEKVHQRHSDCFVNNIVYENCFIIGKELNLIKEQTMEVITFSYLKLR